MKKKIIIFLFLIIVLVAINIIGVYIQERENKKPILNGYTSKETIIDDETFQSSYKYEKYIYNQNFDEQFENNDYYKKNDVDRGMIIKKYEKYFDKMPDDIRNKVNIKELFLEDNYYYDNDLSDDELKFYLYIYNPEEHILNYIKVVE